MERMESAWTAKRKIPTLRASFGRTNPSGRCAAVELMALLRPRTCDLAQWTGKNITTGKKTEMAAGTPLGAPLELDALR